MLTFLLLQSTLLTTPVSGGTDETAAETTSSLSMAVIQEDAVEKTSNWSGLADISFTDVAGNSNSSNGAANLTLDWAEGLHKVKLGAHYSGVRTEDTTGNSTTTSRLYAYEAAYNRYFSDAENLFTYAAFGTRQDEPNGLQMRATSGVGFGYTFHVYEEARIDLEGGVSYVTENKIGTLNDTSAVGRAAFDFAGPCTWMDDVNFTATGVYLSGGNIESYVQDLGVKWDFSTNWHLSLTNGIAWDGNPSAGFTSTDRRWNLLIGTEF
ncbi:MAG: DUF481 domain-containing protein [Planctomycetota bacterium]